MAEPTMREVLDELATQRDQLATLHGTLRQQGAELALYRRRRRYGRAARHLLPILLAALLVALVPLATLAANPFTDLTGGVHDPNIDAIYTAGITTGCDPGVAYCPRGNVTREEMASFLARTAGLGSNPPVANAATVGGLAPSGLVRVARGEVPARSGTTELVALPARPPLQAPIYTAVRTVTITVPGDGFVLVQGSTTVGTNQSCNCGAEARLTAPDGLTSPATFAWTGNVAGRVGFSTLGTAWVFPVTGAGERTFTLELASMVNAVQYAGYSNGGITALFVPFGATGGATLGVGEP
jgi:hypothetical protein